MVVRWFFRRELAVFVSDLSWRPSAYAHFLIIPTLLGHLHMLSPVFILGCCLASIIGLLRKSDAEMSAAKALRDMALAGGIATALWVGALILLGQSDSRSYMLHPYYWYPLYGAAALLGAILTKGIRASERLGS